MMRGMWAGLLVHAGDPPRIPTDPHPPRPVWRRCGGGMGLFGRGIDSATLHCHNTAMSDEPRYSLTELADLGGVTPRTVRYYLGQGLLPAVGPSGPGSKYGADAPGPAPAHPPPPGGAPPAGRDPAPARRPRRGRHPGPGRRGAAVAAAGLRARLPAGRARSVRAAPPRPPRRRRRPCPRRPWRSLRRRRRPCRLAAPVDAGPPSHAVGEALAVRHPPTTRRTAGHRTLPVGPHRRSPPTSSSTSDARSRGPSRKGRPPRGDRP